MRFGAFEFHVETRELLKHGHRIRLQDQPAIILQLLLENPGAIVSREQLKQEIWPDNTFVEYEAGLNTAVSKLRAALTDSTANPVYVERVPKQGYRFVAPANIVAPVTSPVPPVPELPQVGEPVAIAPSLSPGSGRKKWIAIGVAAALVVSLGLMWILGKSTLARMGNEAESRSVVRYTITLPANQRLGGDSGRVVGISADGRSIAYIAFNGSTPQIYAKRIGEEAFQPLPGTQDASDLFFSPDGSDLFFWAKSHLVRLNMESKSSTLLVNWPDKYGHPSGVAGGDGVLYYGNQVTGTPNVEASLARMDPSGKASRLPIRPSGLTESVFVNQILPGGELLASRNLGPADRAVILYSARDGSEKVLLDAAMGGYYLPTGHLIYTWKGNLLAAPFNLHKMAATGPGVVVISGVAVRRWAGPQAVMSDSGTLVWVPAASGNRQLFWVDRTGKESPLDLPPSPYDLLALSPTGNRILIARRESPQVQTIWDYDMSSRKWSRLMSGDWENTSGVWSPDESKVVVSAVLRGEKFENLYMTPVATPAPERIAPSPLFQFVQDWSTSGVLFYTSTHGDINGKDLMDLEPGKAPADLVATKGNDMGGSLSPDGRWLAFSSDVSGAEEVYIKPFPGKGAELQISHGGGTAPLWSPKGGELFYRSRDEMWSVYLSGEKLIAARQLFSGAYTRPSAWNRRYSVTPDGKRFLMMRDVSEPEDFRRIQVVENWSSELQRMIPNDR